MNNKIGQRLELIGWIGVGVWFVPLIVLYLQGVTTLFWVVAAICAAIGLFASLQSSKTRHLLDNPQPFFVRLEPERALQVVRQLMQSDNNWTLHLDNPADNLLIFKCQRVIRVLSSGEVDDMTMDVQALPVSGGGAEVQLKFFVFDRGGWGDNMINYTTTSIENALRQYG